MGEIKLMKGNEAIAEAAIRVGCDAYFGYPITPQSEVMEYLAAEKPEERTGMVLLQAESEIGAINMIFGAASAGKKVMTSSSSPGISLMQECISYIAGAELPCVIVNVVRGGPGLGTIQPSQADYFQSVKGGGHGDYRLLVLAPDSVQEMSDHVKLGFDLAFKYRNPVMIQSDGVIGQMMEKVEFFDPIPRSTEIQPWATLGRKGMRKKNVITSLDLDPYQNEMHNHFLQEKYRKMEMDEVRFEEYNCEGKLDYLIVAYGCSARVSKKVIEYAKNEKGLNIGLLRPITLFPFPKLQIEKLSKNVKAILSVEMSAGQMIEDIKLTVGKGVRVEHYGRYGGVVHNPEDVWNGFKEIFLNE